MTALFFIVPAASVGLVLILIQADAFPLTPEQRAAVGRLPARQLIVSDSEMTLNLAGGILLLRRYRAALRLLLLSATIVVANWAYFTAIGQFPASAITSPTAFATNLLHIECLAFAYILHRRGFLYRTFSRKTSNPRACTPWTAPSP